MKLFCQAHRRTTKRMGNMCTGGAWAEMATEQIKMLFKMCTHPSLHRIQARCKPVMIHHARCKPVVVQHEIPAHRIQARCKPVKLDDCQTPGNLRNRIGFWRNSGKTKPNKSLGSQRTSAATAQPVGAYRPPPTPLTQHMHTHKQRYTAHVLKGHKS